METTNPSSKPLSSYPPGELLSSSSPSPSPTATNGPTRPDPGQYKECLRNHAASVGGNVVDGCGEFMPEPSDSLKCSVCGCHRSFHRRHTVYNNYFRANGGTTTRVPPLLALPPPRHPLNPPPVAAFSGGGGGGTTESSGEEMEARRRKRFRTRFTAEQKERMLGFAEAVGWRMHRKDDLAVDHFCREINVSRQVFKVWMHNNKHLSLSSKPQLQPQPQPQPHQGGDECKDNERYE